MNDLLHQIGTRLYTRRKQLRLTQEELAEKAGITAQTISYAELGKKALRPENIVKLCIALNISTDYLLLGKITVSDHVLFSEELSKLSPKQYRYLEDIMNSFIKAVTSDSK